MDQDRAGGRLVRPYTMTGGRTGKDLPPIALEAIVVATPQGQKMKSQLRWEASHIIDLTRGGSALSAYPEYNKVVERDGLRATPAACSDAPGDDARPTAAERADGPVEAHGRSAAAGVAVPALLEALAVVTRAAPPSARPSTSSRGWRSSSGAASTAAAQIRQPSRLPGSSSAARNCAKNPWISDSTSSTWDCLNERFTSALPLTIPRRSI